MYNNSIFERLNAWIANSISVKLASIGLLILLLLIPMTMIEELITERQYTRQEAQNEISDKWGHEQTIVGPVLSIPYKTYIATIDESGKESTLEQIVTAYFLPDDLKIVGRVDPETRYRGIYEVVVYQSDLKISGTFNKPDFSVWNVRDQDILWDEALISLGIPDMRGIQDNVNLQWGEATYDFNPGAKLKNLIQSGISTTVDISSEAATQPFSIDLALNGSGNIGFAPMGKETNVELQSPWPNPSFVGAFLPDDREISEAGFKANWKVLHLNRNFPQQWRDSYQNFSEAAFGLNLLLPVDEYQKSTRSAKYATLFIGLTFLIFFFVEVKNKIRIHPFQYILVGLALCVFYALLVSLSEHINYNLAYVIATTGVVGIISAYSSSVFGQKMLVLVMSGVLVLLYTFLFVVIQSQDFALLIGSVALFVILGFVMYLSRNVNWYHNVPDGAQA